jgi:hypothetical protein
MVTPGKRLCPHFARDLAREQIQECRGAAHFIAGETTHELPLPTSYALGDFSVQCGGRPIAAFRLGGSWRKIQAAKSSLSLAESANYGETRVIAFGRALSGNCRALNLG